jgi:hypothetical protein
MIWDIIRDKLEGAGLATRGQSLFIHAFPPDVNVGVGLFEPLGGIICDPHIPNFYKPELRVIVRHNKVREGRALAEQVMRTLTVRGEELYPANADRGEAELKVFYPKSLPIQFPALDGKTFEWSLNFRTAFSLQSSI